MRLNTTIGIWFFKRQRLVLIDRRSIQPQTSRKTALDEIDFRLVATRKPHARAATGDADAGRRMILAPWPPLHPQDVPMVLPCDHTGMEVFIYGVDEGISEIATLNGEMFICDPNIGLQDAVYWWVLGCSEHAQGGVLAERPFDAVAQVWRSAVSISAPDWSPADVIAAARSATPAMRRSSVYVLSPVSDGRLGRAQVICYGPPMRALQVRFQLESTRCGFTQPKAIIQIIHAEHKGNVGEALANLCVFQLHRNGPACGIYPELAFAGLGRDADCIGAASISTGFFPPVRTGDVIGVMARGVDLEPSPGFQASALTCSRQNSANGWQVQMTVRQEEGFLPVEDDIELEQSGRLDGLKAALEKRCPEIDEEYLVKTLLDWVWHRVELLLSYAVDELGDPAISANGHGTVPPRKMERLFHRKVDAILADRNAGVPGYLLYTAAFPGELAAKIKRRELIDSPWKQIEGTPDAERLKTYLAQVVRSSVPKNRNPEE